MMRALLICCCLLAVSACNSPPPEQVHNAKKEQEGNAWRGVMQALAAAPADDAKATILERFIEENPGHPDIAEAEMRLAALKKGPEDATKKLVSEVAQKAFQEGEPVAMLTLFASESVRQSRERLQRDALAAPIKVATADGEVEVAKSLFVHPLVMRGHIRRAVTTFAADKVEKRCGRECINEAVSGFLKPTIGGPLFLEEGKMNPEAVGPLLEKLWVDPETPLLGVPASSWYSIFAPTFRAYVDVRRALSDDAIKAGAAKLAGLKDAKEISQFYTDWANEAKLAEKTQLAASDARAVAGWWLRRTNDGTAPLFDAQITKVIEGYAPELGAKK